MSYGRLAAYIIGVALVAIVIWVIYARIIKNPATTYQRAEEIINPHYDYHPTFGFGCAHFPEVKK